MSRRHVLTGLEAGALVLVAAVLILGRAGFAGSPISYVVVSGHSMEPTFHTGDVVVLRRASHYRRGQVVAYEVPKGSTGEGLVVIHRIIGGGPRDGYLIRGDNKPAPDPWRPHPSDVVGNEVLMVPKLGLWIAYLRTPLGMAFLAGLVAAAIALGGSGGEGRSPETGSLSALTPVSRRRRRRPMLPAWRRGGSYAVPPPFSSSARSSASAASARRRRSSRARRSAVRRSGT